jgi:hypothetical protein
VEERAANAQKHTMAIASRFRQAGRFRGSAIDVVRNATPCCTSFPLEGRNPAQNVPLGSGVGIFLKSTSVSITGDRSEV